MTSDLETGIEFQPHFELRQITCWVPEYTSEKPDVGRRCLSRVMIGELGLGTGGSKTSLNPETVILVWF